MDLMMDSKFPGSRDDDTASRFLKCLSATFIFAKKKVNDISTTMKRSARGSRKASMTKSSLAFPPFTGKREESPDGAG